MGDLAIHEINLEKSYLSAGEDMSYQLAQSDPGERVTVVADVVRGLAAAWTAGARVALLSIDSFGGSFPAGIELMTALGDWSAAGGKVVAFISGTAASSASWYFLPADYVVAHARSTIAIHGMVTTNKDGQAVSGAPEAHEQARALKRNIFEAGTTTPVEQIECWIGTPGSFEETGVRLNAREARRLNFVDEIGGRMRALEVARRFVEGKPVESRRQAAISPRRQALMRRLGTVPSGLDGMVARRVAQGQHIADAAIGPAKLAADALQTTGYTEDAYGNATAGAKLDRTGDAIKVPPRSMRIGNSTFEKQLTQALLSGYVPHIAMAATGGVGNWVCANLDGSVVFNAHGSSGNVWRNGVATAAANVTPYGDAIWFDAQSLFCIASNSSGGITTVGTTGAFTPRDSGGWLSICYNPYLAVAVATADSSGLNTRVGRSANGTSWTQPTLPVSGVWQGCCSLDDALGSTGKGFLVVGCSAAASTGNVVACYSATGAAWSAVSLPGNTSNAVSGARTSSSAPVSGVVCGMVNGIAFILTYNSGWWANVSDDLTLSASWNLFSHLLGTPLKCKQTNTMATVAFSGQYIVRSSIDGRNWLRMTAPPAYGCNDGGIVAVGSSYGMYCARMYALSKGTNIGSVAVSATANEYLD